MTITCRKQHRPLSCSCGACLEKLFSGPTQTPSIIKKQITPGTPPPLNVFEACDSCFVKGCITAAYESRSNVVVNGELVCSRVCELEVLSNTLKGYERLGRVSPVND